MSAAKFLKDLLGACGILALGATIGLIAHPEALRASPVVTVGDRTESFVPSTVSIADAKSAFEAGKAIFVDARQPDFYKAVHVLGALPLYTQAYKPEWRALRRWLPTDDLVIVVGENSGDFNAARIASQLRMFGVRHARSLDGGIEAWKKSGLPTATGWDVSGVFLPEVR